MVLAKIADLYPNYRDDIFNGNDIKRFSVYSDNDQKVGSVYDLLVDEEGRFRYVVINTGFLGLGKRVLVPVGVAEIDYDRDRVDIKGFTKEQAENLPEYHDDTNLDYDYEEKVRGIFRTLNIGAPTPAYDRDNYNYDYDPALYQIDHLNQFKLFEDNLVTHKEQFQLGEGVNRNRLYKIADLYPNYKDEIFGGNDLKGDSVYSDAEEKIGDVYDILVDESGRFRYLVVNTGFLGIGKKLLLPVGRARIDAGQDRIYATGLNQEQAQHLPEYHDDLTVDYDYEERVRNTYRTPTTNNMVTTPDYDRNTYSYDRNPDFYQLNEPTHHQFKLYQDRLLTHKDNFHRGDRADDMGLYRISELYPNYSDDIFGNDDLKGYSVYTDNDERVGSVDDLLVDGDGHFRYFVVDTGFLGFGKKVLLPVGYSSIDRDRNRVYVAGFTKEQAQNLPEYNEGAIVDSDFEERVINAFQQPASSPVAATIETELPVETASTTTTAVYENADYSYEKEPSLYQMSNDNHQLLRLYEERLVASKNRISAGTVRVGKHVETETARVSIPVEKERVIIERKNPTEITAVTPDAYAFQEGEVARIELFEESANIQKQAFIREEVEIKKEIQHDIVNAEDTVRREELDVDIKDNPALDTIENNGR
ncbi:MAG: PRC-barrel domain-containing protein [Xenococcaceae cyanobacterium]